MSEAPADTATPTPAEAAESGTEVTETTDTVTPDLAAEVEKWKTQSRKHEDRAKANLEAAKELERIKREALPEQERLVAEAKASARAELLSEFGSERVESAVRIATSGRPVDVDALLEGIDRSRFLTEDGKADTAAISAWVDRIAPAPTEPDPAASPWPDLGQGAFTPAVGVSDPLLADLKSHLGI